MPYSSIEAEDENGAFTFTVSSLVRELKDTLEGGYSSVSVCGEISQISRSRHAYFSLKDENSLLSCVMFASSLNKLKFVPEQGMRVVVRGRVTVYDKRGQLQLNAWSMKPEGQGVLALAFEQLKKKLGNEGLFDEEHKKELPEYPKCVGVLSSPTGAALQDILSVSKRRAPMIDIIVYPSLVQGDTAAANIASMIRLANKRKETDVLIVGRGGGSLEDLWAFNEEETARAIYNSKIPVVSAVGHETDFSISDYCADLRAATPSAAAELVFPDMRADVDFVYEANQKMIRSIENKLRFIKARLEGLSSEKLIRLVSNQIEDKERELDDYSKSIARNIDEALGAKKNELAFLSGKLSILSPLNVLARGFTAVKKEDSFVKSVKELRTGDDVELLFKDGKKDCQVK